MVRIQSFLFATTMALVLLLLGVAEVQGAAIRVDNEPTSRSSLKKKSSLPFSTKSLSPVRRSFVSRWFSIQADPTNPTNNPALDSSSDSVEFSQSGSLNLLRSKKDELLDQAQVAAEEAEEEEHIGGRLAGGGGDDGDDEGIAGRGGAASWWQRQRRRQRESKQWRMEDAKRGKKRL